MKYSEIRNAYLQFFKHQKHVVIEPAPLVLQGDATTLFTSSGMQPLVPYLTGKEKHTQGTRLVDIQPCIRTADIEEVGDASHTTFFEMLGNWSLGDYFKEEQLAWKWEFLTSVLKLPQERLYVTVFEGSQDVPKDTESADIWKKLGVKDDHLYYYGYDSNWWSRSGVPSAMPIGEIGGPDSEIFYDFGEGPHNGPASDETRFLEIGNSVFIQYVKDETGGLSRLSQKNVDFGGGLERILAACNNNSDVYTTDLFTSLIETIERVTQKSYTDASYDMRVIADHLRAATFLIHTGVVPSNKEHGYILRRLLRRSAVRIHHLLGGSKGMLQLSECVIPIINTYKGIYFDGSETDSITKVIDDEMNRFSLTLERGLREIQKRTHISASVAFNLFQSYGFPIELTHEIALQQGMVLDLEEVEKEKMKHRQLSQSSSAGKFKGGLADSSDQVVKFHTATHLLHKALQDMYGDTVRQEGSNITQDRLRFDVKLDRKPSDDEIQKLEEVINAKVQESLPVFKVELPRKEAEMLGAASFFKEKYGDIVSVYCIGGSLENLSLSYSKELCGGPHVSNTSEVGPLAITQVKKIGSNTIRFYVEKASQ